ncbi:hypothetical protein MRX96_009318 [Rhipicephalus microplus]
MGRRPGLKHRLLHVPLKKYTEEHRRLELHKEPRVSTLCFSCVLINKQAKALPSLTERGDDIAAVNRLPAGSSTHTLAVFDELQERLLLLRAVRDMVRHRPVLARTCALGSELLVDQVNDAVVRRRAGCSASMLKSATTDPKRKKRRRKRTTEKMVG